MQFQVFISPYKDALNFCLISSSAVFALSNSWSHGYCQIESQRYKMSK